MSVLSRSAWCVGGSGARARLAAQWNRFEWRGRGMRTGFAAGPLAARIRLTPVICAWAIRALTPLSEPASCPSHGGRLGTIQPLLPWSGGHPIRLRLRPPCSQSPEHLLHYLLHRPRSQRARIAGKWAISRWPVESHRPPQIRRMSPRAAAATQYGPLAQLVEQETLNLLVVGSIPTRPTNSKNYVSNLTNLRRYYAGANESIPSSVTASAVALLRI